jgi:hypothetical protein
LEYDYTASATLSFSFPIRFSSERRIGLIYGGGGIVKNTTLAIEKLK